MKSDNEFDRLAELWKEQEVKEMEIDIRAIEKKARSFARTVAVRNALEWAAGAVLVVICAVKAAGAEAILETGSYVALALGAVFVSLYLFLKGRTSRLPDPSTDTRGYAQAHRSQLLSQARLLRRVPLWYLAPLALGTIGLITHAVIEVDGSNGEGMWAVILTGLFAAAVFGTVAALNLRKAAQLEARAKSMDS